MKSVIDEMNSYGFRGKDELLENFSNAKKNKCFMNLISKLNLADDILMKYTSSLEECSNNFYICSKCKGLSNCPFSLKGYCYLPRVVDSKLEFDYLPCKFMSDKLRRDSYKNNVYSFGVSLDSLDASLDNVYSNDSNLDEK